MSAISLPSKTDLDFMREHVECPICREIPHDGVMLLCKNNHNVCATCKNRLDKDKGNANTTCPQGRCDYDDPPRRNRTVANLIQSLPFEFTCKYSKRFFVRCKFKGTIDVLKDHESICDYRFVECPSCEESVPANRIISHYGNVHTRLRVVRKASDYDVIEQCCLWRQEYSELSKSFSCPTRLYVVNEGRAFTCAHLQDGLMYLWLQMVSPIRITEKLKCLITLGKDEYLVNAVGPVYPIDWTRERILKDDDCVRLNVWIIRKMLTDEKIAEEYKKDGYCSTFDVTFKIVKKTV